MKRLVLVAMMALLCSGAFAADNEFRQGKIGTLAFMNDDDAAHLANYRQAKWWPEMLKLVGQSSRRGEVTDVPPNTKIQVTEQRGATIRGFIKGGSRELWFQGRDFEIINQQTFEEGS